MNDSHPSGTGPAWRMPERATVIASRNNPTIKQIRSLRLRKAREQTGLFFIEGVRLVTEAVQQGADIALFLVAPEALHGGFGQTLLQVQRHTRAPTLTVTPDILQSLAEREDAQGIGAVVRQRWETLDTIRPARNRCWVALDGVQFPGNLGTILRACDAVGCEGVLLLGPSADPYDPLAVRASMGAVLSQRLARASVEEFLAWKRRHEITVVGTSPSASADYREVSYHPPTVLLMGSERQGLSGEPETLCDVMVRIPMVGRCDSLNVALAAGILLYEVFHQCRRE